MYKRRIFFIIIIFGAAVLAAQNDLDEFDRDFLEQPAPKVQQQPAAPATSKTPVRQKVVRKRKVVEPDISELRWTYEAYLYGENQKVSEAQFNPGNEVLKTPHTSALFDQRVEVKWLVNDAKIIFRPRWIFTYDRWKTEYTDENKQSTIGKVDITDAFWEQLWYVDRFSTTAGLEVYQWGPGEILNPSNPFFHFAPDQRSLTYKEKGKVLVRANLNLNPENSIVIAAEPVSNNEPVWISEKPFKSQGLIKYEKSWEGTRNYLGVVGGQSDDTSSFFGEYFQWEFLEGWSTYGDFKHSSNKVVYAPASNGLTFDMVESDLASKKSSDLGVLGIRYEGDFDIRLEYLHNSAGYNKEEYANALASVSNFFSPNYLVNVRRFAQPGLELIGRGYLYASLRITDPFGLSDFNFYARNFYSLMGYADKTAGLWQLEFDKVAFGSATVFGGYAASYGEKESEFRVLNDWRTSLGLKVIF